MVIIGLTLQKNTLLKHDSNDRGNQQGPILVHVCNNVPVVLVDGSYSFEDYKF